MAMNRRVQQLEKAVATARRRESELSGLNGSLEAKVERLTKELKGARPAPVSRAKVADLEERAVLSERLLAEAQAMVAELQEQVGELSVAKAARDAALRESRTHPP